MHQEFIIIGIEQGVATVSINRLAARNALSIALVDELTAALDRLDKDPAVKVVILRGEGSHFAAGTDVKEMRSLAMTDVFATDFCGCSERLGTMAKPVVASVEGYAFGGGCELVEMCDIVIASETAKFGHPEITVGTMSGCGGTQRLPRAIGKHRAMDVLLTGRPMSAEEAFRFGLVSRIVPPDRLMEETMIVARRIASLSGPVVRMIKSAVMQGLDMPLANGLDLERRMFHLTFSLDDRAEGMTAFVEKRPPTFRDR